MINNMQSDDPKPATPSTVEERKAQFNRIVGEHCADGVIAGVLAFIKKNNVNCAPGPNCKTDNVMVEFTDLLTAELDKDQKAKFPFEDSFDKFLEQKLVLDGANFLALYSFGYLDALGKLVQVAAAAGTAEYLEAHREPALKLIRQLRGVD